MKISYTKLSGFPVGKIAKKLSLGVRFVNLALKLQCILLKIHSYRLLGEFAHWFSLIVTRPTYSSLLQFDKTLMVPSEEKTQTLACLAWISILNIHIYLYILHRFCDGMY